MSRHISELDSFRESDIINMITFPNQPIKIQAFVETGEYGNILRTGCFVLTEKELAANQENLKGLLARKKQELKKAMGIK